MVVGVIVIAIVFQLLQLQGRGRSHTVLSAEMFYIEIRNVWLRWQSFDVFWIMHTYSEK